MDYKFCYKNKDGEPCKAAFYSDKHSMDKMLDQINIAKFNIIDEDEFNLLTKDIKLMTLDIKDEFSGDKIGELTLEEQDVSDLEVIG